MFNADYFNQFHESETYQAGEILIGEGDAGDTIYAIQQGEVQVVHNGDVLATLGPGELVGEMALIDQMPRSATVIALTDVRVVPVDPDHFYALLQKTPVFGTRVMHLISSRLRRAAGLEPIVQPDFYATE
ncbi:MAG: cyclic nucleotide-binding domain-containing protein [Anaerolineae bacterium]|nr:cyclic nucleotide-binding domain-containing protein [Anaerolineae bacterium]